MLRDHKPSVPGQQHSIGTNVLLIRDSTNPVVYRAEVLKLAGFFVRAITQLDFPTLLNDGAAVFNAVVLCHSLSAEDLRSIIRALHLRNPRPKIILIEGADPRGSNSVGCDLIVDSLAGPEALINGIRQLCAAVTDSTQE